MRNVSHFLALSAAALIATAAPAQTPAGYYVAVPATQPTRATLMTRATPWTLKGNAYVAARAPERDAVLCDLVAKNAGALTAFTVAGKPYGADQLTKCNTHAKTSATASVAAR